MDKRVLPFSTPTTGREEEEAIAVLSTVAEDLLADHFQRVQEIRLQAYRLGRIAVAVMLLSFFLFLIQDFEQAPLALLLLLALPGIAAAALALYLRTRLVEADRFETPEIVDARKLFWQWIALPIDDDQVILWDTVTDEALPIDLPPPPPSRSGLFLRDLDPIESLDEERQLIFNLNRHLRDWRAPSEAVRLPRVQEGQEEILALLRRLPRGRHVQPGPLLSAARSLEEGRRDLEALLHLKKDHRVFVRQMDAWQEALPQFEAELVAALHRTLPEMEAPPPPPSAHPSGDVEALLASVDLVRSTTIEELRVPLADALTDQEEALARKMRELDEERDRERSVVHFSNDTLINALQRQISDMKDRIIPEAEQALRESQIKLNEARGRVATLEGELAGKRKQLLQAGSGRVGSPRASDDRRRELSAAVDRLEGSLSESKHGVTTWEEVVAAHERGAERGRRQLANLQKEHADYVKQREEQLGKIDENHQSRSKRITGSFEPLTDSISQDLAFFDLIVDRFSDTLDPFRVDLVMDDERVRPYNQVVLQSQRLLGAKERAVQEWSRQINTLIDRRRESVLQIVREINAAAIPNFGLRAPRLMLLPVWYVESRRGRAALWPWQTDEGQTRRQLVAPFEESPEGRRVALPGGESQRLRPHRFLHERLERLLAGARGEQILAEAARRGRPVPFDLDRLHAVGLAAQMPRMMVEMLQPLHTPERQIGATAPPAALPAPWTDVDPDSDDFVPPPTPGSADAWTLEEAPEQSSDAWEGGAGAPLPGVSPFLLGGNGSGGEEETDEERPSGR